MLHNQSEATIWFRFYRQDKGRVLNTQRECFEVLLSSQRELYLFADTTLSWSDDDVTPLDASSYVLGDTSRFLLVQGRGFPVARKSYSDAGHYNQQDCNCY